MNPIEPNRTALCLMDLQAEIVAMLGDKAPALLERAARLAAAARAAKIQIIHVVVGFRPGYPELNPRSMSYARIAPTGRFVSAMPDIAAAVRPQEGDITIVKHRVSAFFGTDFDLVLRANGIETLVLAGIATSGVVLSTVRHGSDAGYSLVVVKDCCGDADDEVHRVLTEKVFPRQSTVTTADELIATLPKA